MRRIVAALVVAAIGMVANAQYASQGVRLLSRIALNQFPGSPQEGSACFGWTSPSGREYAVMGLFNGNSIVDITNPTVPVQLNHIPGPNSSWHENTTMFGYCYAVSDGSGAVGIQIIDLTNVDSGQAFLSAIYNGVSVGRSLTNVHTIQSDPTTRRLFANGSNRGFVVFDATNPTLPVELGRWTTAYVHDCFVKNYSSGTYAGKQIAFLFCGTAGMYIVDITNPAAMIQMGFTKYYPSGGSNMYCHSGSPTADMRYMLVNDEFDEARGLTGSATTVVIDVQNLSNPVKVAAFASGLNAIDHNSNLRDGYLFLSAYEGGLRIYDASSPMAMTEVGYFDTYPSNTSMTYNGDWGVYALYPSRNAILSDRQRGLFVVDPSEAIGFGAPITGMNWSTGTPSTSNVRNLRESDDVDIVVTPLARSGLQFFTTHTSTVTPANTIDVMVEGRGNVQVILALLNRTTGQYDVVKTGQFVPSADAVLSQTGIPAANYRNAAGQIDMRVQVYPFNRNTAPTSFDVVRVKVNR